MVGDSVFAQRRSRETARIPQGTDGALAQLGERLICIQEVSGSIPLGSTKRLFAKQKSA